jgi:hypothetical protein
MFWLEPPNMLVLDAGTTASKALTPERLCSE